ncbi:MAG: YicC family protein [candidate division KSB1 bacterium]|nr:YicC family protein [candidate division KSB1 bacterium]
MIASMTGFGTAVWSEDGIEATTEVRAFNNRFLDVSVHLPRFLANRDQEVKEIVRRHVTRGRVNVSVAVKMENNSALGLKVDLDMAQAYKHLLEELNEKLQLQDRVRLDHLVGLPDIFGVESDQERAEKAWAVAERALGMALEQMIAMRAQEGAELRRDLEKRIALLEEKVGRIEALSQERASELMHRFRARVQALAQDVSVDENRLAQEVAILADRMDVTEECVRFHSHTKLFLASMDGDEPPGRRLNFLLQEMQREANTIGAKAADADISHLVVELKDEVEKIREQVQNIE